MDIYVDAIVGLLGVIAGALITSAGQRAKVKAENDKIKAETNEIIRETVMELIKPLRERIDELECELSDWMDWANELVTQIKEQGHDPVPFKSSKKKG